MAKHNPEIQKEFVSAMEGSGTMSEFELLDALKPTIITIEKDDSYSTSAKLKIFSLISSLSNCAPKERQKYVRKISNALR